MIEETLKQAKAFYSNQENVNEFERWKTNRQKKKRR